ncbi:MAG: Gldg family protein [Bacteroidales bacterium]|nr:Gldg family protein [Bacteroidales bacterium]
MKTILKIAANEFRLLFFSPVAWLMLIIFVLQTAISYTDLLSNYVRYMDLGYDYPGLSYDIFGGRRGLLIIVQTYLYLYIPLLTMNLMSREYSSGTINLLYSSPVKNRQIILGKYLSMIYIGIIFVAVLLVYVISGGFFISHFDMRATLIGLLGIFFLICTYSAIGLFMSSITKYPIVAALSSFVTFACLGYIDNIGQGIPFIRNLTYWLSIKSRANTFVSGLICSEDVIYFIALSGMFVLLSMMRLRNSRQSIGRGKRFFDYALCVIVLGSVAYVSAKPAFMAFYDGTATKSQTLTPNSQKIMAKLKGRVTMTTYNNVLASDSWFAFPRNQVSDMRRFRMYTRFKPNLKMKYIQYYHKNDEEFMSRKYKRLTTVQRAEKVCETMRVNFNRVLPPEKMASFSILPDEKYHFVRVIKAANGKNARLRLFDDMMKHPSEAEISAAFKRLVMSVPVVGFVAGHGERSYRNEGDKGYSIFAEDKSFRYSLINQGFDFCQVDLKAGVPDKVDILVLADPKASLLPEEMEHLQSYLSKGGNLFILTEPEDSKYIGSVLDIFGVSIEPGEIETNRTDFDKDFIYSHATKTGCDTSYQLDYMVKKGKYVVTPSVAAINYSGVKDFQTIPMLECGRDTLCWLNNNGKKTAGRFVTCLALRRKTASGVQKIMVLGDADCLTNGEISIQRKNVKASNYSLITAGFSFLSDNRAPVDVRRPEMKDKVINLSFRTIPYVKWGFLGLLPFLLLCTGVVIVVRRKRS